VGLEVDQDDVKDLVTSHNGEINTEDIQNIRELRSARQRPRCRHAHFRAQNF
jgi:hypothetical protein